MAMSGEALNSSGAASSDEVEIVRTAIGPSPAMRQALEELRKKSMKDNNINFHLALCHYREYPAKALEPLNAINLSEEQRRSTQKESAKKAVSSSLPPSETSNSSLPAEPSEPVPDFDARLAAKALILFAFTMASSHFRSTPQFMNTMEYLDSLLASRSPSPGKWTPDTAFRALTAIKTASEVDPRNISALSALGIVTMQLGKLDEAEKIFKQVYEGSGENYIDALVNRGICLLLMNDNANDEATVCFQEALNKDPTHLEALTNYAVILFKHRRYDDAISILEKTSALYKADPFVWNNLGVAYACVGLHSEAQACFLKVDTLRKSTASATAILASSSLNNLKPDPRTEANVGLSLFSANDLLRSHEQFMKVLETDAENANMWTMMGKVFDAALEQADGGAKDSQDSDEEVLFSKALHSISQSLSIDKSNASTWNALGGIYLRRGYFKEAVQALNAAVQRSPDTPAYWCNYALAQHLELQHFRENGPRDAEKESALGSTLQMLKTRFADNLSALNNVGNIERDIGKVADSIQTLKGALERFPKSPILINNLGLSYWSSGNTVEASKCFQEAQSLDPALAAASMNTKVAQNLQTNS